MKAKVRFLGLDVHAATIAVAVAEPDGSVRSLGTIANRAESIRTLAGRVGSAHQRLFPAKTEIHILQALQDRVFF